MTKNKVILSIAVCIGVFFMLYGYQDLIVTEEINMVDQALINGFDFEISFLVGLLSGLLVLVLTYHKEKIDPSILTEEYIRAKFSASDLEKFETLDEETKQGIYDYYHYYQNHFDLDDEADCLNYMEKIQPKTNRFVKFGLLGVICCSLILVLSSVHLDYVSAKEQYNEMLRQQEEAYNQIVTEQYLYYDGLPTIEILPGNNLKAGDVQKYVDEFIRTQPQFLLDNCRLIKFCEPQNFDAIAVADGVDIENRGFGAYAYASSSDFSITLQMDVDKDYGQKGTVGHELTHIFDYANANYYTYNDISDSYEWQRLHEMAPRSLGEYGREDTAEFFADAGEMYINYPEELMEANIDIYNFMNNLYQDTKMTRLQMNTIF